LLAAVPVAAQAGEPSTDNRAAAEQRKTEAVTKARDAAKERAKERSANSKETADSPTVSAQNLADLKDDAKKMSISSVKTQIKN
jgi:hypothetical protein